MCRFLQPTRRRRSRSTRRGSLSSVWFERMGKKSKRVDLVGIAGVGVRRDVMRTVYGMLIQVRVKRLRIFVASCVRLERPLVSLLLILETCATLRFGLLGLLELIILRILLVPRLCGGILAIAVSFSSMTSDLHKRMECRADLEVPGLFVAATQNSTRCRRRQFEHGTVALF
jgi:hypothetical protein